MVTAVQDSRNRQPQLGVAHGGVDLAYGTQHARMVKIFTRPSHSI